MRKGNMTILASVFIIASIMFSLGLGTMAYFSDTETSTGNTFTAGTLDLKASSTQSLGDDPYIVHIEISDIKPGYGFTAAHGYIWELKNVGSIPGELDIKISAITNTESTGTTEYENDMIGGIGVGELGDNLWIKFSLQYWLPSPSTKFGYAKWYINEYSGHEWDGGTTNVIKLACGATGTELLDPGQSVWFRIQTGGVLLGVGNSIQGDSVSFDVIFTLEQPGAD